MFFRQRVAANATLSYLFGCAGHRIAIAVDVVASIGFLAMNRGTKKVDVGRLDLTITIKVDVWRWLAKGLKPKIGSRAIRVGVPVGIARINRR